jgi:hypothetical protein
MPTQSAFLPLPRLTISAAACLLIGACGFTSAPDDDAVAIPAAALIGGGAPAQAQAPAKPSGIPAKNGVIVQAGDSIGFGLGADNWAAIEHLGLPPGIKIHNPSVSGKWMLTGLGERDKEIYPFRDPKHTSVLLIEQGSNDLFGGSSARHLHDNILRPFVALSKAAGFYVAVNTVLPRRDDGWMANPEFERQRLEYNDLVRANTVGADTIIDTAADPELGDRADPATSGLFADRVHPNRAGQERLVKIYTKPLSLLLQYPPRAPRTPAS